MLFWQMTQLLLYKMIEYRKVITNWEIQSNQQF